MGNLKSGEKRLILDEIMFYSICSDEDREKIIGKREMSFEDFRRFSLLTDYLDLEAQHKFIWDLHAHRYMDQIESVYQKCEEQDQNIPAMLDKALGWLNDFADQAPNQTVEYLLQQIFANGLTPYGNSKKER